MAKTKEEIRDLLSKIQELPYFLDHLAYKTDDHICNELDVRTTKLVQAIIDDDIDAVVCAFTGWDIEGLLFGESSPLHRFILEPKPPKEGAPVHTPPTDGHWCQEDYTWECCPECDTEQVIYSKGITACPNCGLPLAPCSCCDIQCGDGEDCPYGCTGTNEDERKAVTNPPISDAEQKWYASLSPLPVEDDSECPWDADSEGEDDADSEEFECCYNCDECEINGNCERQEHLNEVDCEVDDL